MHKLAAVLVFTISLVGFVPLLLISILGTRDIQLETAQMCMNYWNKP
jgi:hypothetical protein